ADSPHSYQRRRVWEECAVRACAGARVGAATHALAHARTRSPVSRLRWVATPETTTRMTDSPSRQERLNLWATCAAQFLTLAGVTAVLPLLPLYLQHIGVTDRATLKYWTGILGAAPFAVAVFATPVWGALADRVGYKPMVVRSVFGLALSTAGMGVSATP